jgi:hypothetical protein
MSDITPPRESWEAWNVHVIPLTIGDLPTPVTLPANGSASNPVQLLVGTNTVEAIMNSGVLRNYANQGYIVTDYRHDHPQYSLNGHIHSGLDILTAGATSNADALHTHANLRSDAEFEVAVRSIIDSVIDLNDYVLKAGSITQLSDITSTGAQIESAVSMAHAEAHAIDSHDTIATGSQLNMLVDGSNADCLHTHLIPSGSHNDLGGLNEGDYWHLTAAEYLDYVTLTDGSNADHLHTHSGSIGVHNSLSGLQGGDSDEFYHLSFDQFLTLTGGPSVNADEYHTHDLGGGGYITVQDEGVDVCSTVTTINFKGSTVQAKDCVNGTVNVYIPPPSYVSHFDTTDGTNDCSVGDLSTTTRYISAPTSEGSPFNIGDWTGGTQHSAIGTSSAAITYTSTNACSFYDDSTTTIEVNIYDADGVTTLAAHTTSAITGNTDVTVDNVRIQVTSWAADTDKYRGVITVSFNIDTILVGNGLDSGRFSVEIIHHDGSDGDFSYTQNDVFYDDQSQTQAIGNVTVAENAPSIVYKSGVMAYGAGSTFTVAIDDLDYLNTETYPQPFVRILGSEYNLSTLSLSSGNLTSWSNVWSNTNATYSNSSWAVNSSLFFTRTTTANITAQTIDWGAWGEVADASPNASIIIDTYTDNSTRVLEDFRGETERLQSDLATSWDNTASLATQDGGTGLQVGEGTYLFYPGHSNMSPAFPTANGDYGDYAPNAVSQPDYSSLTGTRYFYRGMWHTSTAHSNGLFNITGVTEANISADAVIIEISLDGTNWFNCNEEYMGGVLSDGQGCRINSDTQNMTLNGNLQFTLGTGGATSLSTGPGWGIWLRISMPDTSTVQMNKIEITDWA